MSKGKILFFVTEDWVFCSHRLPLAVAAKEAGYDVVVVTRVREHGDLIKKAGLKLVPIELSRRGMNPFRELNLLFTLYRIYRRERPDLVHNVAIKPVLYGSLVSVLTSCKGVVNAITGMGSLFISESRKAKILKPFVTKAFQLLLNRPKSVLVLQNPDDVKMFSDKKIVDQEKIKLIRGSGVNVDVFRPTTNQSTSPVVMLASRMLWDKGINEFIEAVKLLKKKDIDAQFVLVGKNDPENPSSIPDEVLAGWRDSGLVEWWGHKSDMPETLSYADIACLPSYREGLPKSLLEAAACGLPIITTDVPGCREVVVDKVTGFIVSVKESDGLAQAMEKLIEDEHLRLEMGEKAREIAVKEFSDEVIISEFINIYESLVVTT